MLLAAACGEKKEEQKEEPTSTFLTVMEGHLSARVGVITSMLIRNFQAQTARTVTRLLRSKMEDVTRFLSDSCYFCFCCAQLPRHERGFYCFSGPVCNLTIAGEAGRRVNC